MITDDYGCGRNEGGDGTCEQAQEFSDDQHASDGGSITRTARGGRSSGAAGTVSAQRLSSGGFTAAFSSSVSPSAEKKSESLDILEPLKRDELPLSPVRVYTLKPRVATRDRGCRRRSADIERENSDKCPITFLYILIGS